MAVREGWTRCARPTGSLFATRSGCPTGCASCRTLSRGFSSLPQACYMRKKSPHFHASSSLNMAVREGWTRCARPAGSLFAARSGCPTGCRQLSNPQSRVLIPPFRENINEKSPYFRTSSHLKYGGEGGIRTLDTLPYTHFPGVLLQPLGHLTILFCCLSSRGQRGATIGSQAKSVKQIFCINARSVKQ